MSRVSGSAGSNPAPSASSVKLTPMFREMDTLNTHELAWAAGTFDAEGHAGSSPHHRGHVRVPLVEVSQAGVEVPALLIRFRRAIGGLGYITGPRRGYLYYWRSNQRSVVRAVACLLWPWLGELKKRQFRNALVLPHDGEMQHSSSPGNAASQAHCRAWAAGFFGGEGWIGGAAAAPGRYRWIRMTIAQATYDGRVPDNLIRFRMAVGGLGFIHGPYKPTNPWSRHPQYMWASASYRDVVEILEGISPWLDVDRRRRAGDALSRYRLDPVTPPVGESPVR